MRLQRAIRKREKEAEVLIQRNLERDINPEIKITQLHDAEKTLLLKELEDHLSARLKGATSGAKVKVIDETTNKEKSVAPPNAYTEKEIIDARDVILSGDVASIEKNTVIQEIMREANKEEKKENFTFEDFLSKGRETRLNILLGKPILAPNGEMTRDTTGEIGILKRDRDEKVVRTGNSIASAVGAALCLFPPTLPAGIITLGVTTAINIAAEAGWIKKLIGKIRNAKEEKIIPFEQQPAVPPVPDPTPTMTHAPTHPKPEVTVAATPVASEKKESHVTQNMTATSNVKHDHVHGSTNIIGHVVPPTKINGEHVDATTPSKNKNTAGATVKPAKVSAATSPTKVSTDDVADAKQLSEFTHLKNK
jgi:hypothetical protein